MDEVHAISGGMNESMDQVITCDGRIHTTADRKLATAVRMHAFRDRLDRCSSRKCLNHGFMNVGPAARLLHPWMRAFKDRRT